MAARSRLTPVLQVFALLVGLYGLVCLALWLFQARLVYFPDGPPTTTPASAGLKFKDVKLTTEDGVELAAWFVQPPFEPRGAVVFSHGNAGNIGDRLGGAAAFCRMGFSVLLYDYRGYGASQGTPSEDGTYLDALAAYDHVASRGFSAERVFSYGESLGGAVAVELARRRPVAGLIVEDSFTSATDVGAALYPWLPVRLLARVRYESEEKLPEIHAPVLVIHSPADEIVPYVHGQRLFNAAHDPKQFLATDGGHNDGGFLRRERYREHVHRFLEMALVKKVESGTW